MTKKFQATLILISLALISPLAAVPSAFSQNSSSGSGSDSSGGGEKIKKELRQNMRDQEVVKLQQELKKQGVFKTPTTGFFGPLTEKAVKEFQKKNDLIETGIVDEPTRDKLNEQPDNQPSVSQKSSASQEPSVNSGPGKAPKVTANTAGQIKDLMETVKQLLAKLQKMQDELNQEKAETAEQNVPEEKVDAQAQAAAGIIITGSISGPGYPTGPLNLTVPASQLLLDRLGQVKAGEVKDRQYEAPIETIPPTIGSFPVTINGVANTASELKVVSNLKTKNGVGQHQGTIDVDIDTIPAGHVTLQYNGTATVAGATITSKGTFKTAKTTGIFAGLVAEGTYEMTIVESGSTFGSPATITITTVSP